MVYPGALHTRFHHSMGALHLMNQAIHALRLKDVKISEQEALDAGIAILLHDLGHGPFSHALENSIVENIDHEIISRFYMDKLNEELDGKLDGAIKVFQNTCDRAFLHQMVSSQLDMDRLDYLKRDSFYTGVSEGIVSVERIIKMLHVVDDRLVVEEKGIYSIEKFIIARRLMYWQVYLHKAVLSAENMIIKILSRARELTMSGVKLGCSPVLEFFLRNHIGHNELLHDPEGCPAFTDADLFHFQPPGLIDYPVKNQLCLCRVTHKSAEIDRFEKAQRPVLPGGIENRGRRYNGMRACQSDIEQIRSFHIDRYGGFSCFHFPLLDDLLFQILYPG